ncbi:MAG: LapA family protein [Proteobacteria bacterium]|nr:LapA family protein [Pseudomonadota bacterium]
MSILRIAKYLFLFIVAVALVLMALANRETVVVEMVPEALVGWFGVQYAIALPLFLVILGAVMVGILVGFVWEWLREYRYRADAKIHKRAAQSLEREVKTLKGGTGRDAQDEILALVDGPGPAR